MNTVDRDYLFCAQSTARGSINVLEFVKKSIDEPNKPHYFEEATKAQLDIVIKSLEHLLRITELGLEHEQ